MDTPTHPHLGEVGDMGRRGNLSPFFVRGEF